MNTIIALRGVGNSGKSTTIRILRSLLLSAGYITKTSTDEGENKGDFTAVLSINGKEVGLTSTGDTYDMVHRHLQDLVNHKCRVCVCACRSFDRKPPGTNAAIREFSEYEHIFVEKSIDNNHTTQLQTNSNDAAALLARITKLLEVSP